MDQNIIGALGIADYVYVMRTGALFTEGPRSDFTDDVETLVSRWLYHALISLPASPASRGESSASHC